MKSVITSDASAGPPFSVIVEQWSTLCESNLTNAADQLLWQGSIPTFRRLWDSIRDQGNQLGWTKQVWADCYLPRAAWTVYIACHQRLLTLDRLQKFGFLLANRCSLCQRDMETAQHLFFDCYIAQNVWRKAVSLFRKRRSPIRNIIQDGGILLTTGWMTKCWKMTFHLVIWQLWTIRNRCVFQEECYPLKRVLQEVKHAWIENYLALDRSAEDRSAIKNWLAGFPLISQWSPPPPDVVKLSIHHFQRSTGCCVVFT